MRFGKTVLICGSRYGSQKLYDFARAIVHKQCFVGNRVIVGDADGVDSVVVQAVERIGCSYTCYGISELPRNGAICYERVPVEEFFPAKKQYQMRDDFMIRQADIVIALWNGYSKGTKHVADTALSLGKIVYLRTDSQVVYS